MTRKWRPGLAFVLGGALSGTLALAFSGLVTYRYLGPEIGFRDAAILLAIVIAAATTVLGWLLVRLLLRPINDLKRFALQAAAAPTEDLTTPTHFGTRELEVTARRVIDMAQTLHNRETSLRSFADHTTHELKTPVAAIRAATELLEDGGSLSSEDQRLVALIVGANTQMALHLEAMQRVVQAREVRHMGHTTLNDVQRDITSKFEAVTFQFSGTSTLIPLAQHGLIIVLKHLLENAVEHGADQVSVTAIRNGDDIELSISDNGTGISDGNAGRVFDPFFTTKRALGGTGMGLSIVQNLLRAHGGQIQASSNRKGAHFQVKFHELPIG